MAAGGRHFPSAQEFSPGQVGLRRVLGIAKTHEGDRAATVNAILDEYPLLTGNTTRAGNIRIGMKEYGLYDLATSKLTEVGEALLATPDDTILFRDFARQVLMNCEGLETLQVVLDLSNRGEKPGKSSIDAELRRRGYELPADTQHHTTLITWLRPSGVFPNKKSYEVDEAIVFDLTGVRLGDVDEWASMSREQRSFLRALRHRAEVAGTSPVPVKEVRAAAEMHFGVEFKANLRAKVLVPLDGAGWLAATGWQSAGKSGNVAATQKLIDLDVDVAARLSGGLIPPELRTRLNTSLTDIHAGLDAADTYTRGFSLELLALRIAYDIGLTPMGFRERSAETGGAEVDLLAEGAHLLFSRWLFQCKHVKSNVGLADLAKEIGMAMLLRAHVIVMVTTGKFSTTVAEHAQRAAENTHLQIVLIDGEVLARHRKSGSALLDFFQAQATETLALKRGQAAGIV